MTLIGEAGKLPQADVSGSLSRMPVSSAVRKTWDGSWDMAVIAMFPIKIREIETLWIPMPDGCRLAGRVWMPEDAERNPVPAILEYIPYRRRDGTRDGDDLTHPYFAGHGYACIRLDIRGSGD